MQVGGLAAALLSVLWSGIAAERPPLLPGKRKRFHAAGSSLHPALVGKVRRKRNLVKDSDFLRNDSGFPRNDSDLPRNDSGFLKAVADWGKPFEKIGVDREAVQKLMTKCTQVAGQLLVDAVTDDELDWIRVGLRSAIVPVVKQAKERCEGIVADEHDSAPDLRDICNELAHPWFEQLLDVGSEQVPPLFETFLQERRIISKPDRFVNAAEAWLIPFSALGVGSGAQEVLLSTCRDVAEVITHMPRDADADAMRGKLRGAISPVVLKALEICGHIATDEQDIFREYLRGVCLQLNHKDGWVNQFLNDGTHGTLPPFLERLLGSAEAEASEEMSEEQLSLLLESLL